MIINLGKINLAFKHMRECDLHNWQAQRGGHLNSQLGCERRSLTGFTDPEIKYLVQYSNRVMRYKGDTQEPN